MRGGRGFTLTELAVVLAIVGLLLGSLMYTLSAQIEQRNFEETRRRLELARELLLSYAFVNGRLPCPAICTDAPTCTAGGGEAPTGGTTCTSSYGGFLPARTIGYQQVDSGGYALDAWGNRIRYAVSATTWGTGAQFTKQHVASNTSAAWSISTTPSDLVICASATGITATTCGTATIVTNQNVVVAIIFSTGKNGAFPCATCTDEAANTNGDQVFVFHTPAPTGAAGGEFDDQFTWLTVGELYGKLIAAGVLP